MKNQSQIKSSRLGQLLGEANNRIETLQGELDHVTTQRNSLRESLAARNAFAKRLERQYREALADMERLKQTSAYSQDGKAYCLVCQSIANLEKNITSHLDREAANTATN